MKTISWPGGGEFPGLIKKDKSFLNKRKTIYIKYLLKVC